MYLLPQYLQLFFLFSERLSQLDCFHSLLLYIFYSIHITNLMPLWVFYKMHGSTLGSCPYSTFILALFVTFFYRLLYKMWLSMSEAVC